AGARSTGGSGSPPRRPARPRPTARPRRAASRAARWGRSAGRSQRERSRRTGCRRSRNRRRSTARARRACPSAACGPSGGRGACRRFGTRSSRTCPRGLVRGVGSAGVPHRPSSRCAVGGWLLGGPGAASPGPTGTSEGRGSVVDLAAAPGVLRLVVLRGRGGGAGDLRHRGGGVAQARADIVDLDLVAGALLAVAGLVAALAETADDDDACAASDAGLGEVL